MALKFVDCFETIEVDWKVKTQRKVNLRIEITKPETKSKSLYWNCV